MKTKKISRRKFIQTGLCAVGTGGVVLALLNNNAKADDFVFIRPPGALEPDDFYAACINCGLCVEACPYDTLSLFDINKGKDAGTPYFVARDIPCEMCVDIPCVSACPTGALDPGLTDIRQAEMGVAVLTNPQRCNSYIGASYCDSCFRACPLEGEAISMQYGKTPMGGMFMPVVDPDVCTGCGKCEAACIAEPQAISIIPKNV